MNILGKDIGSIVRKYLLPPINKKLRNILNTDLIPFIIGIRYSIDNKYVFDSSIMAFKYHYPFKNIKYSYLGSYWTIRKLI